MFSRIVGVVLGWSLLNWLVTWCLENQLSVICTGRTRYSGGLAVLEFTIGVMTSRRAKLPMALFKIIGEGVGDKICSGLGNMACRDMCELIGDSLGNGRMI